MDKMKIFMEMFCCLNQTLYLCIIRRTSIETLFFCFFPVFLHFFKLSIRICLLFNRVVPLPPLCYTQKSFSIRAPAREDELFKSIHF